MKKNKKIIAILFVVLLFTSCNKKNNAGPTYTISGHLYQDCNMQPITNTFMDIIQGGGGGILATTTTDSTGYFKFSFKDVARDFAKIRANGSGGYYEIMIDVPWQTNIDNLVLYKNPTTNIKVSLNVINAHSANDTLAINDYRDGSNLSIPGPFISGMIYFVPNYNLLTMHYGGESKRLSWAIYPNHTTQYDTYFKIEKYCNDTIFVTANIN